MDRSRRRLWAVFAHRLLLSIVIALRVHSASSLLGKTRAFRISRRNSLAAAISMTARAAIIDIEEREEGPVWDPLEQIWVGGMIPGENARVNAMIEESQGCLRLFGYGSLCWNPGAGALAHASVKHTLGRARGYRRCWAQKSTDHRGNPSFPGVVCTLLKDEEFQEFRQPLSNEEESLTEGLLYEVPPELVEECLAELDFREKGGYARDVITVVEDESGDTVQALLYRGTPDNPAFWPRALRDLPFAAAVMSVAVGPSGENEVYLNQLDRFLEDAASPGTLEKFDDTFALTAMANELKNNYELFFLFGSGSNQHNQLLLANEDNAADLDNGEDAHKMTEIVACVKAPVNGDSSLDLAVKVFAGSGHSGILTESGRLFLFGWNDNGQLGNSGFSSSGDPLPVVSSLDGIRIKDACLGFSHTLVIEKDTGRLFAFGDNSKGQVSGIASDMISDPITPSFLGDDKVVAVSAGLFHSVAATSEGELVTFGCSRFGQSLSSVKSDGTVSIGRWRPPDGTKIVKVACGRRHTVALDDRGRLWSFGDNKYGQLGRTLSGVKQDASPQLVTSQESFYDVACGWSHAVALAKDKEGCSVVCGWGRNDKGQLGTGLTAGVPVPVRVFSSHTVQAFACGSESTVVLDSEDNIWSCGWNEHGNLSTGKNLDCLELTKAVGARIVGAPGYTNSRTCIAAGGAHMLAMKVILS